MSRWSLYNHAKDPSYINIWLHTSIYSAEKLTVRTEENHALLTALKQIEWSPESEELKVKRPEAEPFW